MVHVYQTIATAFFVDVDFHRDELKVKNHVEMVARLDATRKGWMNTFEALENHTSSKLTF
jgi:hypothetical protein